MLTNELKNFLYEIGAELVGFADMHGVPECAYPRAASAALAVPRHILREIADGPTRSYYYMYHELNNGLNRIMTSAAEYIRAHGYAAEPLTTDAVRKTGPFNTALPHKTAAVRAGLGWIGKSCLLITPEYGSAVRISTLLTDAPLTCAEPLKPRCGQCSACVEACPAHALSGKTWSCETPRSDIVDPERCMEKQCELTKARTGIETDLCGKCFVVCQYTKRYLESA